MTIIDYDEINEILCVKFNTDTLWKYGSISKDKYKEIVSSSDPENVVKELLHKSFIVGTYKKESEL